MEYSDQGNWSTNTPIQTQAILQTPQLEKKTLLTRKGTQIINSEFFQK